MERQHSVPLLLPSGSGDAVPLKPVPQQAGGDAVSEAYIQALVHEHPACLPIAEIDAMFAGPVEAIAEYLQLHAGLHFSLGLVELPIYAMPNGDRLVAPRVLVRTALVIRNVVAVPDGYTLDEAEDPTSVAEIDPERTALGDQSQRFWTEFLDNYLKLDDPEQPKPKPARLGYISFPLPARTSSLTVFRSFRPDRVGIFLSWWRDTPGAYAMQTIFEEWKAGGAIKDELGETVRLDKTGRGSVDTIIDRLQVGSFDQPEARKRAFSWLAERVNTFVNVLRPRMRSLAADYQSRGE